MDTPEPRTPRLAGTDGPFLVGDRVKGASYVPPALRMREAPEPVEGVVVQVGSGYPDAEPLCDICKIGRAPFLRYGTLENTGRMCSACLHRTHICALCQQPGNAPLVAVSTVDQGTGPGRTTYACAACAASTTATSPGLDCNRVADSDVDQKS